MDDELIMAFKEKDHASILERLQPLFRKYLKGIPFWDQQEFLQEYYLVCMQTVEGYAFENP